MYIVHTHPYILLCTRRRLIEFVRISHRLQGGRWYSSYILRKWITFIHRRRRYILHTTPSLWAYMWLVKVLAVEQFITSFQSTSYSGGKGSSFFIHSYFFSCFLFFENQGKNVYAFLTK